MIFQVRLHHNAPESPTQIHAIGILVQIQEALQPDGLFLAAMFGGETLFELR
jgi:hypothetical protein